MKIPAIPQPRDFNPLTDRRPQDFGINYPLLLVNLFARAQRTLGVLPALTYPRAGDGNHWVAKNLQDPVAQAQAFPFGYWKGTEGTWYVDATRGLALTLRQAGQIQFLYHFFRRNAPGKVQATWFHTHCGGLVGQIGGKPICLIDYETGDGVSNGVGNVAFQDLCDELHTLGYLVGLYTSPSLAQQFGLNAQWVNLYVDFFIIAEYHPGNTPTKPSEWDSQKLMAHQEGVLGLHSWVQPMPGIIPQFDANFLLWSLAQLENFTGQKWEGNVPPPGDDDMKEVQCVTLGSYLNLRSNHNASAIDVGNFFKGVKAQCFPAHTFVKKPDFPNKEIWLLIILADGTVGWVAAWHPTIKTPAGEQYEAVIFTVPAV